MFGEKKGEPGKAPTLQQAEGGCWGCVVADGSGPTTCSGTGWGCLVLAALASARRDEKEKQKHRSREEKTSGAIFKEGGLGDWGLRRAGGSVLSRE